MENTTIKFAQLSVTLAECLGRRLPPTFPQRTQQPKWKSYSELLSDIGKIGVTVDVHYIYPMHVARVYSPNSFALCRDYTAETTWAAVRTALKATVLILQNPEKAAE